MIIYKYSTRVLYKFTFSLLVIFVAVTDMSPNRNDQRKSGASCEKKVSISVGLAYNIYESIIQDDRKDYIMDIAENFSTSETTGGK